MIQKNCIVRKIVIFVILCIGIFSFFKIYNYKEYRTCDSILTRYNIINKTYQHANVSRAEAIISLSKVLGASDDWATKGIYGTNPALIESYSDYPEFVMDYDNLCLGYMGLLSRVICAVDTEKNDYRTKLRPKDDMTKKEALEYMMICIENKNVDRNKSILYRAQKEKLIDYRDLIFFLRLNTPISEKQYHKLLYNLLNHNRYLFLNKEIDFYVEYDLDSYFDKSITYKQYLDETGYYDGDNVINETLNGSGYATNVMGADGYISRRQNGTTGYLFRNAHGDIVAAYSSTTNKLADYAYNAWGEKENETEQNGFKNNPIRYNGQYYDYESGMTYLRARYYDSSLKRFITEDPAKDGTNWYAYAGNNPVMFVDPSGLKIYVPDNQGIILDYLRVLSRDDLYIDSYGYVSSLSQGENVYDRNVGTDLIRQLISNDNQLTIMDSNVNTSTPEYLDLASVSGVGTNVTVEFISDFNKQNIVYAYNENGGVVEEREPVQMALGHELIHALRSMKGNRKATNKKGTNIMNGGNGEQWHQEEFDTVGIDHIRDDRTYADASNWYFTENSLRREHGYSMRARYIGKIR